MRSSIPTQHSPTRTRAGVVLALVVGAVGIYKAIESMASPALPILQTELDASRAEVAWVITGLLLTGPVVTPLIGRLGDIFNKRTVLMVVLGIVGLGTLTSALSVSMPMLIAGQLMQGFGLSTVPLAVGIMRETQPEGRLGFGNGLMVGMIFACTALAMLIAGPIADHFHYSVLFWVPLALLVVLSIFCRLLIPSLPPEPGASRRVDVTGVVLFGGGLAVFLIALTYAPEWGWLSAKFLGCVALAVLLLVAFVIVELRLDDPLVDMRILASRQVIAATVLMISAGLGINIFFVSLPMQVQQPLETGYGLAATGTTTSFILVPGVLIGTLAPVVSLLEKRLGPLVAALSGPVLLAAGLIVCWQSAGSFFLAMLAMLFVGLSAGMSITQAMNLVVAAVPSERVTAFSGMNFVVKAIGATTGAQVAASILSTDAAGAGQSPRWEAFQHVFLFGLAGAAVTIVVTLLTISNRRHRRALSEQTPTPVTTAAGNTVSETPRSS